MDSKLTLQLAENLRQLASNIEALAASESEGNVTAPPANKKAVTLEEVRSTLAVKKQEGKSIRELLQRYGAKKLTDIDPAKYANLLKDAGEL